MRIKRWRCGNACTNGRQDGNGRHTPRACCGVAIFCPHRDAVARHADKAEPLSSLLRNNNTITTTNQVGIQEARSRDEARVLDGRDANALQ